MLTSPHQQPAHDKRSKAELPLHHTIAFPLQRRPPTLKETDAAAAIHKAMEEARRYKKSWTINEAKRDMRSGEWGRRRHEYRKLQANARLAEVGISHRTSPCGRSRGT